MTAVKAAALLPLAALLAVLAARPAAAQEEAELPRDVDALVALVERSRDDVDLAVVRRLADLGTREAMEGLLEAYELVGSIYVRRAVLRELASFDRVEEAWEPALEAVASAATGAKERELREAAVDLLAGAEVHGPALLRRIVDAPADDAVRERAMERLVALRRPEDAAWLRAVWEPAAERRERAKRGRGDDEEATPQAHPLPELRALAFEAIRGDLTPDELAAAAVDDGHRRVRLLALDELDARDPEAAEDAAEELFDRHGEPAATRLAAAEVLLRERGSRFAKELLKEATRRDADRELVRGAAELLGALDDASVRKSILKKVGKGRGEERLFYLLAARGIDDPDVDEELVELAEDDDDPEVRRLAMEALAARGHREAAPTLEAVALDPEEPPLVVAAAVEALTELRRDDPAWEARLVELSRAERTPVRNAALEALGGTRDAEHLPVLVAALGHPDWSTRLAAARGLERLRVPEAVGALVERLGAESGRMARELAGALWRLTGEPYGTNAAAWARWWQGEGPTLELVSEAELRRLEAEEEERRLRQVSRTEFFGIRIESHRVAFVLDVSGSMNEPTRGRYRGESGPARIDVAKAELLNALEGLETGAFFNLIVFSGDVLSWSDQVVERTEASLEEARSFVSRLGAGGGTNLYGGLREAFDDPDVDTIFVLSDGEPSAGERVDPMAILEDVLWWNEHRDVVIHTVALGGSFRVLEWLAEETGGTHVRYP